MVNPFLSYQSEVYISLFWDENPSFPSYTSLSYMFLY